MDNEKRYIVEKIAAELMEACTIHDSGLFLCILNMELNKYHKSELEKISNEILNSETEIINSPIRFNGVGISTIKHVFKEHGIENKQIF